MSGSFSAAGSLSRTGEGWGEGVASDVKRGADPVQHIVEPIPDISVRDPKNLKAFGLQLQRALSVIILLMQVLRAVHFDYQLRREAEKVHDVGPDRNLPPKLVPSEASSSELLPQRIFERGLPAT